MMHRIKTVIEEIFGLFVDDGRFAVVILVWVLGGGYLLRMLALPAALKAPVLCAGLFAILVESAFRRSRR